MTEPARRSTRKPGRPRPEAREEPLDLSIRSQPLPGPPLVRDYLERTGGAHEFYAGHATRLEDYRRKLGEVQRRFGPEERRITARALRPTSDRARERLERFVRDGGAVVTTGQQSGFLTGPLYTIYKALTVARLARRLEAELGTLVLPVFWNASEDHDWSEIDHADVLGIDGSLRRFHLPATAPIAVPAHDRTIDPEVTSVLDELAHHIGATPFGDRYIRSFREAYSPAARVSDAFVRVLAGWLEPFDLLITDAADGALKAASTEVLARSLEGSRVEGRLVAERTGRLTEAGYHAQVPVVEEGSNVFFHGPAGRERLYRRGGTVAGRESGTEWSLEEVLEAVRSAPERFSPNVLLRPVVESRVFPTLAYVGGPGEIAYFAQLGPLFAEHGMTAPVVVPRASFTLVEPEAAAMLAGLEVSLDEVGGARHELVERLARRWMPAEVRAALAALARATAGGYAELLDAASALDPTLGGAVGSLRNESLALVGRAERKVLRRVKALAAPRLGVVDRVREQLSPGGVPQERVVNASGFLARHGPTLLAAVYEAVGLPLEVARPVHDASAAGAEADIERRAGRGGGSRTE